MVVLGFIHTLIIDRTKFSSSPHDALSLQTHRPISPPPTTMTRPSYPSIPTSTTDGYKPTLKKRTVTIERKKYSIELDNRYRGSRVKVSEVTRDRAFFISLPWETLKWLVATAHTLLSASLNQKFFREVRFPEHTIWVEKTSNKKGTLAEIALLHNNGGLNKLFIPVGEERKGWIAFFQLISNFPPAPLLKPSTYQKTSINQTERHHLNLH